jgi:hypothetical protein
VRPGCPWENTLWGHPLKGPSKWDPSSFFRLACLSAYFGLVFCFLCVCGFFFFLVCFGFLSFLVKHLCICTACV